MFWHCWLSCAKRGRKPTQQPPWVTLATEGVRSRREHAGSHFLGQVVFKVISDKRIRCIILYIRKLVRLCVGKCSIMWNCVECKCPSNTNCRTTILSECHPLSVREPHLQLGLFDHALFLNNLIPNGLSPLGPLLSFSVLGCQNGETQKRRH